MKTVFDNKQLAHVWAQQSQPEGRSRSMRFEGPVLYSYQTPIACFHKAADGSDVVLITSNTYSITTSSKHMPAVRSAVRHIKSFYVPEVGTDFGMPRADAEGRFHSHNLEYFKAEYEKKKLKLTRARDVMLVTESLQSSEDDARDYARTFGLTRTPFDYVVDADAIIKIRAAREAKFNAPGAQEKREVQRSARIAAKERAEDKKRADMLARNADAIADWLANKRDSLGWDVRLPNPLLRVSGDDLQTSQGATVPLAHAIKAFRFIKLIRERGQPWTRNGHTVRVGLFQIDSIDASGNFRAGCHSIQWTEVERIARQLGIFDDAASADAVELTAHAA